MSTSSGFSPELFSSRDSQNKRQLCSPRVILVWFRLDSKTSVLLNLSICMLLMRNYADRRMKAMLAVLLFFTLYTSLFHSSFSLPHYVSLSSLTIFLIFSLFLSLPHSHCPSLSPYSSLARSFSRFSALSHS